MDQTFFLAANSGRGFASCYEDFPGEGVFLHIIKGGPGTGKSGFMRRIRDAAATRGFDTETVLCSGDPDSLDALCIPTLGQAWVDGTAPHVREPVLFGVDSDYVNLGRFCRTPLPEAERQHAAYLNTAYKSCYRDAYALLHTALEAGRSGEEPCLPRPGVRLRRRYLSAITCRGELRLTETLESLCKQNYVSSVAPPDLAAAAEQAAAQGLDVIVCPRPLDAQALEAVLIPALSLALLAPPETQSAAARRAREDAVGKLAEAKALHDELEALIRPAMDFAALDAFTEQSLAALFASC
ncbi:MAG: hypothetical protein K6F56_03010 [Oscillospiraceae bacterium]|nr:hypothetical protein [Oscillospiraceae bacterium]